MPEAARRADAGVENLYTVPWRAVRDARVWLDAAGPPDYAAAEPDVARLERDGVVLLRGIFADRVEALRAGLDRNLAAPGEYAFPCEAVGAGESGRFFDSYCNWQRIPEYRDFVLHSCAASMAARFMRSSTAQFFHDHAFCKEPGTQRETPWHQDLPYYCVDGRQTLSIYVSLDTAPAEVAVRFVKGSHRWGKLYSPLGFSDGNVLGARATALEPAPDVNAHPERYELAQWPLEPGDAVLFDFRTLHGTTGAPLAGRRRAFSTRWLGDDVRYHDRGAQTSPPYPDIGLAPGARMREDWFPVVWREGATKVRDGAESAARDARSGTD